MILRNHLGTLTLALAMLVAITGFAVPASAGMPTGQRLKTLAARRHLLIGGATDLNHNDPNEEAIVKNEYSILSDENCLKPILLQPSLNTFDFSQSDRLLKFCKENSLVAKGHTLLGRDAYLPAWMIDPKFTAPQLQQMLVSHVSTVVKRYKTGSSHGEIKYWDVVNEVITSPSIFDKLGKNSDGDYLYWELAFRTAHEADPGCVLIWNEDSLEIEPAKAEKLYNTIKRLRGKGVPINGVGFQCHIGFAGSPVPDYQYLAQTFQRFADLGLVIVVSEMDVPDSLDSASIYKNILRVCLGQPKCIIWDTWNVVDKYSWRWDKEKGCLLFDESYMAKPSYYAVQSALEETTPKR